MTLRALLRAYPTLLRVGFAEAVAYRAEFLIWVLTRTLPLIMLAMWSAVASEAPVGRFNQADFVAYYLAALIVRQLAGSWVVWELNYEIRQGTLAFRMLRPVHPLIAYSAQNLAAIPMRVLVMLPVAVILLLTVGRAHVTHDPALLAIFVFSIAGAWLLNYATMAAVGTLGMWIESAVGLYDVWLGLFAVLSGYLVPLELFPRWVRVAADILPFRYLLGFPVETLTGALPVGQALGQLAIQWTYALGMVVACAILWRAGLKRYQAYGG